METLTWPSLIKGVLECQKCPLHPHRHVLGTGSKTADLMVIGMSPSKEDSIRGTPFVGPAGTLLRETLASVNSGPVYLTNTVHCRPVDDRGMNRDPTPYELVQCADWLQQEVYLVNPRVVLLLGKTAIPIGFPGARPSQASNKLRAAEWCGATRVFVGCYHPAAVLRQEQLAAEFTASVRAAVKLVSTLRG